MRHIRPTITTIIKFFSFEDRLPLKQITSMKENKPCKLVKMNTCDYVVKPQPQIIAPIHVAPHKALKIVKV